jgi:hypothetical protein
LPGGLIGKQVAPSWAFGAKPGTCDARPVPCLPVPHALRSELIPPRTRSPTERLTSPKPPASQPDSTSLGFLGPSTTHSIEPRMSRPSQTHSVPLSGFLNLSAVSWQDRASRPCFVPLPPGLFLQSSPLAGIVLAFRRHQLPCSHPPARQAALARPYHQPFHRPPRRNAAAWIPDSLWVAFPPAPKR